MTTGSVGSIRDRLDHPILDADGHTVEYLPALIPYFQKAGVADDLKRFFERIFDPGTGMWSALSRLSAIAGARFDLRGGPSRRATPSTSRPRACRA